MTDDYAKIRYKHGPVHAVNAAGTERDGSLWSFYTLCYRRIEHIDDWQEQDRTHPVECGTCIRVVAAWAKQPTRHVDIFPPSAAEGKTT